MTSLYLRKIFLFKDFLNIADNSPIVALSIQNTHFAFCIAIVFRALDCRVGWLVGHNPKLQI